MGDEMMLSTKLAGSIEGFLAMTGLSGRFLDYLGALPPGALLVVDTVHLWLPAVTLVAFLLFGPVAASRVRGTGMGNRAWLALSTALTIRQLVLWFTSLPPVKGMLLAIGIEIIPARERDRSSTRASPTPSPERSAPENASPPSTNRWRTSRRPSRGAIDPMKTPAPVPTPSVPHPRSANPPEQALTLANDSDPSPSPNRDDPHATHARFLLDWPSDSTHPRSASSLASRQPRGG